MPISLVPAAGTPPAPRKTQKPSDPASPSPHPSDSHRATPEREWKNFDEFIETLPYPDFESENSIALWGVCLFFEGLAPLVREGLLDIKYLTGTIGELRTYWSKIDLILNEAREYYNDLGVFRQVEYLYNKLNKYTDEHPELKA